MNTQAERFGNVFGLVGIAAVSGIAIAAVDNFTFRGEISPIVIVAMLLMAATSLGIGWGVRAWYSMLALWVWLPAGHLGKHIMGLADTLHPNTYPSIAALAIFSLVVCSAGFFIGTGLRSAAINSPSHADR